MVLVLPMAEHAKSNGAPMLGRALSVSGMLAIALLTVPSLAAGQDSQETPPEPVFRWRNRPSIQLGDVRLDIRFKTQLDWRTFDPEVDEDRFDRRSLRGGINGEIGNHVEFQIERDLDPDGEWRDVFARWRTYRQFEVSAGRFKVPFGREELTSFSEIDFAYRALVSTTVPPARDSGVMVSGRFLRRGLTYEAGVFDDDGDNGRLQEPQFSVTGNPPNIGPSFAGRVTATPFRPLAETFENLRVGFAYGSVDVPEGLNSLRGETVYGKQFFEPVYVKGKRNRIGAEVAFNPGPVGLSAEWMRAHEERRNQGLDDLDLSDMRTTGWYVSGTWLLTGEDKEGFANPRRSLFDGGAGAIEIAARYETLRFESVDKSGPAFTNPRADHILPNSDDVVTIGVNWFLNRWVRVTINAIREEFDDATRTPVPGTTTFWSAVGRAQLAF